MLLHGRVMLQIKNLFIIEAVEISFVFYDNNMLQKSVISQSGCEKVAKMHFVDIDFDFLAKEKGQRAHFAICYWSIKYMTNPAKTKLHRAWKKDMMLYACI